MTDESLMTNFQEDFRALVRKHEMPQ